MILKKDRKEDIFRKCLFLCKNEGGGRSNESVTDRCYDFPDINT